MKNTFSVLFAAISAGIAGLAALLLVLFLGGWIPYLSINSSPLVALAPAWLTNLGLVLFFGVQHSVMARASFKAWMGRIIPSQLERSVYVLAAGVVLLAIIFLWQPLPQHVWHAKDPFIRAFFVGLFMLGWGLASWAMVAIDGFALFGLRQAGMLAPLPTVFRQGWLHRRVRHPIYTGLILAFWMTPEMTNGHLLFAISMTIYIRIGIYFEERQLLREFGDTYLAYMQKVPMLVPKLRGTE